MMTVAFLASQRLERGRGWDAPPLPALLLVPPSHRRAARQGIAAAERIGSQSLRITGRLGEPLVRNHHLAGRGVPCRSVGRR
jgi:hypothetical protein